MAETVQTGERIFRGIPVSSGVQRGKVLVLGKHSQAIPHRELAEVDIARELERLEQALVQTRHQLNEVQSHVAAATGSANAGIFDAHMLVLEDPAVIDEVTRVISKDRLNAEHAFHQVAEKYAAALGALEDEYLRERAGDMRDVCTRVVNNLLGRADHTDLRRLTEPCIIISHDLTPSTTALLDKKLVLGFGTDIGSKTSHTAIMARALQIPAIVGLGQASRQLQTGDHVLLDGFNGVIIVNPTDQTLFEYGQIARIQADLQDKLRDVHDEPAVTLDGQRIQLSANIGQVADIEGVLSSGAEGVGLFRTEFLFLNRETLPSEEEQYQAYRQVAAALKPQPVVIRTLDLGGDKLLASQEATPEANSFLGWRAIRICLQERGLFRAQLRAILRASAEGNVKLMYPMISGLDELLQANAVLDECKGQLRAENVPFDEAMEVGCMIEIPSAVMIGDSLARRGKFLSLGTNDLIQYTLAVDRLNEKIAHLYEPTNPAVLRLIKLTVEAGHRHGNWVGVCGEMASEPTLVPILLGLGVDELSATPSLVPQIKFLIRRLKMPEVRALAEFALTCESSSEILARSQALARSVAPALFEGRA